jgi:hypothetical protein
MTRRPSQPVEALRISSPVHTGAGADEFGQMVSKVQAAAVAELAEVTRLADVVVAPWYRRASTVAMLVVLAAIVWVAPLLITRAGAPQLSARDRDAALRFAMAQEVVRIEDFRAARGQLPRSLTDVSEVFAGMSLQLLDSATYRLTGTDQDLVLTFRSDSSLKAFLGTSLTTIREHRK